MSTANESSIWETISDTPLTPMILETMYGYPIMEIIHIFGFVIMVGSIALLDVRVLGFAQHLSVKMLARFLLPWTFIGFGISLIAGGTLFVVKAPEWVLLPIFQFKMALLILGGINAGVFHFGAYNRVDQWDCNIVAPIDARLGAALSLLIWATALACGRLLAYFGLG